MKKTLILVIALVLAMGMVACADTYTKDIYKGWNFISAPLVPFDSSVASVFNGFDFTADAALQTIDNGSTVAYDPWDIDNSPIKAVLIGKGYYLQNGAAGTLSYSGVADGVPDSNGTMTDMWISLPKAGWQMIGQPFNHDTYVNKDQSEDGTGDNISFTDGTTVKTWADAVTAGWVDSTASSASGSVGYSFNDSAKFEAGQGYYIQTKVANIAMIIPAY